MSFNSFTYILIALPLVATVHALVRMVSGARAAQWWLLLASLAFYGWSKPSNLLWLGGSILANWAVMRLMSAFRDERHRRALLRLGLGLNIGLLCLFKYLNFFLASLSSLGLPHVALPDWAFPLGISFFTLQQVMFLVDCYEGLVPASSLRDHASFVAFFPYVISGPLARAKTMIPQLAAPQLTSEERFDRAARGLFQFALGLFKKIVFADSFARVADLGFGAAGQWSTLEAWAFTVAYTLQIYFDFSGYSDMAIGSARILGIEIPRNFNTPFRARTVIEFWQRWHISLSAFITTYLYTPILRSFRRATLATAAVATLLAMTVAGLWHGPSWTYVVFGLLHGVGLVTNQYWKKTKRKLPVPLAWAATFAFVNLAFLFFRSPDLASAIHGAARLLPTHGLLGTSVLAQVRSIGIATLVPPLLAGAVAAFIGKNSDELARDFRPTYAAAFGSSALLLLSFLYMNSNIGKQFVYFNF